MENEEKMEKPEEQGEKKKNRGILITIVAAVLCLAIILTFVLCSSPYEYEEIEDRFKELVEASWDVNRILFGVGTETYPRVYDPLESLKTYKLDGQRLYYYYDVADSDTDKRIVAFRSSYLDPFEYMEITKEEKNGKEYDYYDEKAKVYGYILPDYNETKYQLYYKKSDPKDYDYVNGDESGMRSVMDIKNFAETVYSKNYLENTIYESLFDGVATLSEEYLTGRTARYYEYTNSDGEMWLMMSNTYEAVISDERPIYDYSTAKIVRPYRKNFVNVEIEYYYESDPSEIYTVKISMIMQDGVWMLDGQTF